MDVTLQYQNRGATVLVAASGLNADSMLLKRCCLILCDSNEASGLTCIDIPRTLEVENGRLARHVHS